MEFVLANKFNINRPTYLDIGAHDPVYLSNTYFFYRRKAQGVLVEPDPSLSARISKKRPRDKTINAGVGVRGTSSASFYVLDAKTLSTFSKEDAERYVQQGHKITNVMQLPLLDVNELIAENFDAAPNLVSLDVEGLDLDILKSLDFSTCRPEVFCIETLTYTRNFTGQKTKSILAFMQEQDYFVYADTYINTIFVDQKAWDR